MKFDAKSVMIISIMVLVLISLPLYSHPDREQKEIAEAVAVNWWQVPVVVEDRAGNPVTEMNSSDIQAEVNQHALAHFKWVKGAKSAKDASPGKDSYVFLLFDTAMSAQASTSAAKEVAADIVAETPKGTRFFLITIKGYKGLTVIGEGSNDDDGIDSLREMIREEIKGVRKRRIAEVDEIGTVNIPTPDTYTTQKLDGLMSTAARYHQQETMSFINAFQSLAIFLNSIPGKKILYFFSEGNYEPIRTYLAKDTAMYHHYLSGIARDLGRCGAITVIINPGSGLFGESTLQMVANQCGAKYLEGESIDISEKIKKMYRGYYEISFPEAPEWRGAAYEFKINSSRAGVSCYFPQILEKARPYPAMTEAEKQSLVSYLITNPQHGLIKHTITAYNISITKAKKDKDQMVYWITIPPGYVNQPVDLYKFWMRDNNEIAHFEKKSVVPAKDRQEIAFQLSGEEIRHYFVLVDGAGNTARVCGKEAYEPDPEIARQPGEEIIVTAQKLEESELQAMAARTKSSARASDREKPGSEKKQVTVQFTGPLQEIMKGAAAYCDKLKDAVFTYQCREKIQQTRMPLTASGEDQPYISSSDAQNSTYSQLNQIRTQLYTRVNSFEYAHTFSKQGNKIDEKRELRSAPEKIEKKEEAGQEPPVELSAFLAERPLFLPITLLDSGRWELYDYRFDRYDKHKGRRAAVIEVTPKNPEETPTTYGTLWIDMEDFSLLKIEADPRSLRGYNEMNQLAKKLQTKLYLTLESEYEDIYNGIRFPGKIRVLELYKGGPFISEHRGAKGWERNRVVFTFSGYRFTE